MCSVTMTSMVFAGWLTSKPENNPQIVITEIIASEINDPDTFKSVRKAKP